MCPITYFLLKLSTISYAAGPESRGHPRTAWLYIDVKRLPKFHCSLDQPTHENHENWYPTNKSDFTVIHNLFFIEVC